jgi:hypothetical protein
VFALAAGGCSRVSTLRGQGSPSQSVGTASLSTSSEACLRLVVATGRVPWESVVIPRDRFCAPLKPRALEDEERTRL